MPTYDYACDTCGETFEVWHHMTEARPVQHCGLAARRLWTTGATVPSAFAGYWEHGLIPGQRVWITSPAHLARQMKRHGKVFADVPPPRGRPQSSLEKLQVSNAHQARRAAARAANAAREPAYQRAVAEYRRTHGGLDETLQRRERQENDGRTRRWA